MPFTAHPDQIDIAYIAGFIDGEGSIGTIKHHSNNRSPFVQVTQKDVQVLHYIQGIYGGRIILNKHTRCHILEFRKYDLIERILEDTLPYLRVKEKQAILTLIICSYIRRNIETGYRWKGKSGHSPYRERIQELSMEIQHIQSYGRN